MVGSAANVLANCAKLWGKAQLPMQAAVCQSIPMPSQTALYGSAPV